MIKNLDLILRISPIEIFNHNIMRKQDCNTCNGIYEYCNGTNKKITSGSYSFKDKNRCVKCWGPERIPD